MSTSLPVDKYELFTHCLLFDKNVSTSLPHDKNELLTCWQADSEGTLTGLVETRPASHIWPWRPLPHTKVSPRPPTCQSSGRCTAQVMICESIVRSHLLLSCKQWHQHVIPVPTAIWSSPVWPQVHAAVPHMTPVTHTKFTVTPVPCLSGCHKTQT